MAKQQQQRRRPPADDDNKGGKKKKEEEEEKEEKKRRRSENRRLRLTRVSAGDMAAAGPTLRELARLRSRRARLRVLERAPLASLRTLAKIVASVVFMQVPDMLSGDAGRLAVRAMQQNPRYKSMKRALPSRRAFGEILGGYKEPGQYAKLLRPFAAHLGQLLSAVLGFDSGGGGCGGDGGGCAAGGEGQGERQELARGSGGILEEEEGGGSGESGSDDGEDGGDRKGADASSSASSASSSSSASSPPLPVSPSSPAPSVSGVDRADGGAAAAATGGR